ncbi:hypothetical protein GCK72_007547 [Caenorhabditis remanei]|uniref:Uncharacterized protein n=1 Tax=Caenorhabditis remanei TaxID=31234 RepID=A0A6A5HI88_CAERE|nr:hypothetical protein GCK72_007547 [Caenorhabditis remanei]KAF1767588.1 hypothetical protein GCK72_007547 [Caenorhabditis remanei]
MDSPMDSDLIERHDGVTMEFEESNGEEPEEVVKSGEGLVCHRRSSRKTQNNKAQNNNDKEHKENKNEEEKVEKKEEEKMETEQDRKIQGYFEAAISGYPGPPADYVPPELEPPGPDATREEHIAYAFRKQKVTMHSKDYILPYVKDPSVNEKKTIMTMLPKTESQIKHLRSIFDETRAKMEIRKANGEPLIEEKEMEEEEAPKTKRAKKNGKNRAKKDRQQSRQTRQFQDPSQPGPSNRY